MTNREFYVSVVNGTINEEIIAKAKELLVSLDDKNSKAKAKRAEKRNEDKPLENAIVEFVKEKGNALTSEIAVGCEISTSKASALCKRLVESEMLTVEQVKVAKVGLRNSYSIR